MTPQPLLQRVRERRALALASGALEPIATRTAWIEDGGVRFLVRVLPSLARRHAARLEQSAREQASGLRSDPFGPWDPAMWVADLSATHVALLNRFPVLDDHLLVVTRDWAEQEWLLDDADWAAGAAALAALGGLLFYNGGATAGASQPHKHLQVVPLPLAPDAPDLPIAPLFPVAAPGIVARSAALPFAHAWVRLPAATDGPDTRLADRLASACRDALAALGITGRPDAGGLRQSAPYNLLATREWLLVVRRRAEIAAGVPINALGYAGALLVRDDDRLERLRATGPMRVLAAAADPA